MNEKLALKLEGVRIRLEDKGNLIIEASVTESIANILTVDSQGIMQGINRFRALWLGTAFDRVNSVNAQAYAEDGSLIAHYHADSKPESWVITNQLAKDSKVDSHTHTEVKSKVELAESTEEWFSPRFDSATIILKLAQLAFPSIKASDASGSIAREIGKCEAKIDSISKKLISVEGGMRDYSRKMATLKRAGKEGDYAKVRTLYAQAYAAKLELVKSLEAERKLLADKVALLAKTESPAEDSGIDFEAEALAALAELESQVNAAK